MSAVIIEVLRGVAEEFIRSPMGFIAEFVQFLLLFAIGWVVAFGFGKRKGMVANMIAEHGAAVSDRIAWASQAEATLGTSRRGAEQHVKEAKAEAEHLVASAKEECDTEEAHRRQETDDECARLLEHARKAIETEREEMRTELRDELVELVSQATRTILNESLTVSEQRERIEKAIEVSLAAPSGTPAETGEAPAAATGQA